MALSLHSLDPTDSIFKNILADAYLAENRHQEARDLYDSALYEDEWNQNVSDPKLLSHRATCVACSSSIKGIRWKCGHANCIKYNWCMSCGDVRGSVGSSCSHSNQRIQIPSTKHVSTMRDLWESRSRSGDTSMPVRRRTS